MRKIEITDYCCKCSKDVKNLKKPSVNYVPILDGSVTIIVAICNECENKL